MKTKQEKIAGWLLSGIVSLIFVGSGFFKLSGTDGTAEMAKNLGGQSNLIILGVLELFITALFLYNKTGVIGTLLMVAYMGGAMAVHFISGQSMGIVLVAQVLIWVASLVRFPELRQRLFSIIKTN